MPSLHLLKDGCSAGDKFPELRKQQFNAWEHIDNVHMISTSDCGNRFDIHPKNKQPIGIRMALSARQHVYEEAVQGMLLSLWK